MREGGGGVVCGSFEGGSDWTKRAIACLLHHASLEIPQALARLQPIMDFFPFYKRPEDASVLHVPAPAEGRGRIGSAGNFCVI